MFLHRGGAMPTMETFEKVISGGQTGVDRAALDAARSAGIACGGWCPHGRRAEDGTIPAHYPLQETPSGAYSERTRRNVLDADGTLILVVGPLSGGTALTRSLARQHDKPWLVVDLETNASPRAVCDWLDANRIRVLNVAGPRESGSPGIYERAGAFLDKIFHRLVCG